MKIIKTRRAWFLRTYDYIKPLLEKIVDDNVFAIAGQSAFFIILSSVPLAMFIVALLQSLHISRALIENVLEEVFSENLVGQISSFLSDAYTDSAGISLVALIVTLWSAAQGINAMTNGLNRIYSAHENRNWLYRRLRSMLYTVALFALLLVSILIIVLGSALNAFLSENIKYLPDFLGLIFELRYVLVFLAMVIIFAFAYRNLPNISKSEHKEYGFKYQLPGAVLCGVSWCVLSFGISVYVSDFNGFSVYGGLTRLAVLMIWLYFLMVCMMTCAEINFVYHKPIKAFMDRKFNIKKKR